MNVDVNMVRKTVYFSELEFHTRSPQALRLESADLGPNLASMDEGF
jgi:hypothetical protein